jgi:hypothetical protein
VVEVGKAGIGGSLRQSLKVSRSTAIWLPGRPDERWHSCVSRGSPSPGGEGENVRRIYQAPTRAKQIRVKAPTQAMTAGTVNQAGVIIAS